MRDSWPECKRLWQREREREERRGANHTHNGGHQAQEGVLSSCSTTSTAAATKTNSLGKFNQAWPEEEEMTKGASPFPFSRLSPFFEAAASSFLGAPIS